MGDDIFAELSWRGLINQITDPHAGKLLAESQLTIYCGFDPTAASLTTAHLLQMVTLARLQRVGHRVIAVAGGGTGLIGDPSGRESERMLMSEDRVTANVEAIRGQLEAFLDFSEESRGLLVNNAEWLTGIRLTDFLRDVGKHFSMNMMLAKDSVRSRLDEREQGMTFTEFAYMLLQAYDFLHLFDTYGCRLQLGGGDQWGNITAGVDLIRRTRSEAVYGLTTPLIMIGGRKMSKSEGTAVWMDPGMTSPYQFYQYWINVPDGEAVKFLSLYTFLDRRRIEQLARSVERDPAGREAQRVIAWEMTSLVHGESEAEGAKRAAEALFGEGIAGLDEKTLLEVLAEAPTTDVSRERLREVTLTDLLVETGLSGSRSSARTDIQGGGAYLNNRRESDPERSIGVSDLLHGKYLLVRRGKKTYQLVRFL